LKEKDLRNRLYYRKYEKLREKFDETSSTSINQYEVICKLQRDLVEITSEANVSKLDFRRKRPDLAKEPCAATCGRKRELSKPP
jgi:hypothetical protein